MMRFRHHSSVFWLPFLAPDDGGGAGGAGETGGDPAPVLIDIPQGFEAPKDFVADGKLNLTGLTSKLGELAKGDEDKRKAWEGERLAKRPEKPEAYKYETPKSIKLPDGAKLKLDEKDPLLGWWRKTAWDMGLDQSGFEKGVESFFQREAGLFIDPVTEIQKLGEGGKQRLDKVDQWVSGTLKAHFGPGKEGEAQKHYEVLAAHLITADSIVALEALMGAALKSGVPANPGGGSSANDNAPSEAEIDKLMKDERYWHPLKRDEKFVADVQAKMQKLWPGKRRLG